MSKHVPVLARQQIDPGQCRVGGPVHVNRVRLQAHALPVRSKGFHLVEQDDARPAPCELRNDLMEKLGDFFLAATQGRTRQGVGIDLDEARLFALDDAADLIRKSARESRLACAGWAGQHDEAVNGDDLEGKSLSQLKRQHRVSENPLADGFGKLDRRPCGRKVRARQVSLVDIIVSIVQYSHSASQCFFPRAGTFPLRYRCIFGSFIRARSRADPCHGCRSQLSCMSMQTTGRQPSTVPDMHVDSCVSLLIVVQTDNTLRGVPGCMCQGEG